MVARVVVLGAEGMLGSATARRLREAPGLEVLGTGRAPAAGSGLATYAVESSELRDLLGAFGPGDYVINCVGLTKHKMNDQLAVDRSAAVLINAMLPYRLAEIAEERGFHVIQIATDCVYSGAHGGYNELADHDPLDVYGKTKSLGEVPSTHFLNLRCSIVGREVRGRTSLVEWFLSQPERSTIHGYTDHRWNGVTTAVFAELTAGLVSAGSLLSGTHHFVPADIVDKRRLLELVRDRFERDVTIVPVETGHPVDRTLTTIHADVNRQLWTFAGYTEAPTISELVAAMPR